MFPEPFFFTKAQGNGNDFLVLDNRKSTLSWKSYALTARVLCPRGTALGADGLLILEEDASQAIPFQMRIVNADGLEGEMCGNGARVFARYLGELGLCSSGKICFRTLGGVVKASLEGSSVSLDLGMMDLTSLKSPRNLVLENRTFWYRFANIGETGSSGVPHVVMGMEENGLEGYTLHELKELGAQIRHAETTFPGGTNVNFLLSSSRDPLVRTYERGVENFTLSCGTGSIASAAALGSMAGEDLNQPRHVAVHNPGGTNLVHLLPSRKNPQEHHVQLQGETTLVCRGEVAEDLSSKLREAREIL